MNNLLMSDDSPAPTEANPSPIWPKVFLAFFSISLSLLAGEWVMRRLYENVEHITGAAEWETSEYEGVTYYWDTYHPTLGHTNLLNYRSEPDAAFSVTINEQGLRVTDPDRVYAPTAPEGVRRIAVFGDSMTFGEEVDDDQSFPALLEELMPDTEVMNFGIHGYGAGQMMLRLEEDGLAYAPDDVVMCVLIPWNLSWMKKSRFIHPKPVFEIQNGELAIWNTPVPSKLRSPFLTEHSFLAAFLWGRPKHIRADEKGSDVLEILDQILDRARIACEERGIRFTVVFLTIEGADFLDDWAREENAFIRKTFQEEPGLLDLTEPIEDIFEQLGPEMYMPNTHYTEAGNRAVAELIAEHLLSLPTTP